MKNPVTLARDAFTLLRTALARQTDEIEALRAAVAGMRDELARMAERQEAALEALRLHAATAAEFETDRLGRDPARYRDPRCLAFAPGQVYSQVNEDGILAEIFRRIGTGNRRFVEIAAGDGIENTTRLLLDLGWTGLWIEGGAREAASIRTAAREFIESGALVFVESFVDRDTVRELVEPHVDGEVDLLSLDIDYNTSHVWKALDVLKPRVVCIEYNAHYPPGIDFEVPYARDGEWHGTTRFGASLKALERIGREKGYSLVGCDGFGVNAFFVRDDLCTEALFQAPFIAAQHYEPPRYAAVHMRGHNRHGPLPEKSAGES